MLKAKMMRLSSPHPYLLEGPTEGPKKTSKILVMTIPLQHFQRETDLVFPQETLQVLAQLTMIMVKSSSHADLLKDTTVGHITLVEDTPMTPMTVEVTVMMMTMMVIMEMKVLAQDTEVDPLENHQRVTGARAIETMATLPLKMTSMEILRA